MSFKSREEQMQDLSKGIQAYESSALHTTNRIGMQQIALALATITTTSLRPRRRANKGSVSIKKSENLRVIRKNLAIRVLALVRLDNKVALKVLESTHVGWMVQRRDVMMGEKMDFERKMRLSSCCPPVKTTRTFQR